MTAEVLLVKRIRVVEKQSRETIERLNSNVKHFVEAISPAVLKLAGQMNALQTAKNARMRMRSARESSQ